MADAKIISYLRNNTKYSREQLRVQLKQSGYTDEAIAAAEAELDGGPPPPPSPSTTPSSAPQVQAGIRMLHPRVVWKIFLRIFFTWFIFGLYFAGQAVSIFFDKDGSFIVMLVLFLVFFLAITAGGSFFWAKLSYARYKYELTDRGFKKELGVIRKKYVTIPYDRIQNIDMTRSILDRILGLTEVHLQTAGGSGGARRSFGLRGDAEGVLPGLSHEDAEALREEIMQHVEHAAGRAI